MNLSLKVRVSQFHLIEIDSLREFSAIYVSAVKWREDIGPLMYQSAPAIEYPKGITSLKAGELIKREYIIL